MSRRQRTQDRQNARRPGEGDFTDGILSWTKKKDICFYGGKRDGSDRERGGYRDSHGASGGSPLFNTSASMMTAT